MLCGGPAAGRCLLCAQCLAAWGPGWDLPNVCERENLLGLPGGLRGALGMTSLHPT